MKKIYFIALLAGLVVVGGCKMFSADEYLSNQHNSLLMQGHSRNYADGYVDGCATGRYSAGDEKFHYSKNNIRIKSDREYSNGWQQGNMFCKEHYENMVEREQKESYRKRMWDDMKK